MAKKNETNATSVESVMPPQATATGGAKKKPAAAPKKEKPPKKDAAPKPEGEANKRNMSAVSGEFVSTVQKQLSEELANKLRVKDVKEICESFVKVLVASVMEGKNVNFTNNMSFARRVRAARVYKNLKTKESITKPKHYVMTMTVKPALKKQFDGIEVAVA